MEEKLLVSEATTRNLGRGPAVRFNLLGNYYSHSRLLFEYLAKLTLIVFKLIKVDLAVVLCVNMLENPSAEVAVENDDEIGRVPYCTERNL